MRWGAAATVRPARGEDHQPRMAADGYRFQTLIFEVVHSAAVPDAPRERRGKPPKLLPPEKSKEEVANEMITKQSPCQTHFFARHGHGRRTSVPGRDGPGAGRQRREAAGAHGVRLSAQRHHHGRLEPHLLRRASSAELPRILKPLEPYRDDILHLGNLTHNTGRALLDGAGDHGRCSGSYLTGIQVKKTLVDIKAGVSFDQIVANKSAADALPFARTGHGRRAAGRRLRFRLLLRVHQQSGVEERDAAAAADAQSARAVRAALRQWRGR
jgi:hypothetical protein